MSMTLYLIKVIDTFLVCGLLQPKMNRSLKSQVSPVDFPIPIEILFVVFADGAQYTAWVSYRHYVGRDVLCHNASRTDLGIFPNCKGSKHLRTRADHDIIADSRMALSLLLSGAAYLLLG